MQQSTLTWTHSRCGNLILDSHRLLWVEVDLVLRNGKSWQMIFFWGFRATRRFWVPSASPRLGVQPTHKRPWPWWRHSSSGHLEVTGMVFLTKRLSSRMGGLGDAVTQQTLCGQSNLSVYLLFPSLSLISFLSFYLSQIQCQWRKHHPRSPSSSGRRHWNLCCGHWKGPRWSGHGRGQRHGQRSGLRPCLWSVQYSGHWLGG